MTKDKKLMKTAIFYLVIIFTFLLSGCSSSFEITKTVDKENSDVVIYKSSKIQIKGNSMSDRYKTYLTYIGYVNKGKRSYAFDILYQGNQWAVLSKIKLNIDGIESEYVVKSPPIRMQDGLNGLTEELVIKIPNDKIEELIENRKCKMTVIGENLKIETFIKQDWFDKLLLFYAEVNTNI